ncbi:MAG: acyl carrier protein [Planctomycetes bacterium]|nr:acyl carrier protein [Planctomycetota bacterium]
MNENEALEVVLGILRPFARNEQQMAAANHATRLWQDLQINSARFIDILLAFEDRLGVAIDEEQAEDIATVGDVVQLVLRFAAENPDAVERARREP